MKPTAAPASPSDHPRQESGPATMPMPSSVDAAHGLPVQALPRLVVYMLDSIASAVASACSTWPDMVFPPGRQP